jgi:hypothetical protein
MKFPKYEQNLEKIGNGIYSYGTRVAIIEGTTLLQLGYWSQTTQKHINYAAEQCGLTLDRNGF